MLVPKYLFTKKPIQKIEWAIFIFLKLNYQI